MKRSLALIAAVLVAVSAPALAAGDHQGDVCVTTADRIKGDALSALVEEPVELLEAGDLAGAEARLEALLASQSDVEAADTLTAFAVQLSIAAPNGDPLQPALKARAVVYARRAVDAFVRAYGPEHPETILAWQTFGEIAVSAAPDAPSDEAVAALETAYRLSAKVLGGAHYETALRMEFLAGAMGRPARTSGDPQRIAEAAALFEEAIATIVALSCKPDMTEFALLHYLDMLTDNGRPGDAVAAYRRLAPGFPHGRQFAGWQAALHMEGKGHSREAGQLKRLVDSPAFQDAPGG